MKIIYISAPPKNLKSNSHFSLFVASSVKNKTMAMCYLNSLVLIYKYRHIFPTKECKKQKYVHKVLVNPLVKLVQEKKCG